MSFYLHSCAEVTDHPAKHAGKFEEGKGRKPAPAPTSLGDPQRHSPGRVGGRYEEIDDHAVRHVQTMLYRPAAEKAGYRAQPGQMGFGDGGWDGGRRGSWDCLEDRRPRVHVTHSVALPIGLLP